MAKPSWTVLVVGVGVTESFKHTLVGTLCANEMLGRILNESVAQLFGALFPAWTLVLVLLFFFSSVLAWVLSFYKVW